MRTAGIRVVGVLSLALGCGGSAGAPVPVSTAAVGVEPVEEEARIREPPTAVAAGDFHTCALFQGGSVACWGRNRDGELGDGGTAGNRSRPAVVPNLRDVVQVAAGHGFSCARMKGGTVWCWGSGAILGDERRVEKSRPAMVTGVSGAVELRAGGLVACARVTAGAVRCWGTPFIQAGAPTAGVEELAVAGAHACARSLDGKIRCWGERLPQGVARSADLRKVTAIATGDTFVCAIADGAVRCWGRNDQGELGAPPDKATRSKPLAVKNVSGASRLSAAESRACALLEDGTIRCWGSNNEGELGRGTRTPSGVPDPVVGLLAVTHVTMGAGHVCALGADASLSCWGDNRHGQLGVGSLESSATPVRVVF